MCRQVRSCQGRGDIAEVVLIITYTTRRGGKAMYKHLRGKYGSHSLFHGVTFLSSCQLVNVHCALSQFSTKLISLKIGMQPSVVESFGEGCVVYKVSYALSLNKNSTPSSKHLGSFSQQYASILLILSGNKIWVSIRSTNERQVKYDYAGKRKHESCFHYIGLFINRITQQSLEHR